MNQVVFKPLLYFCIAALSLLMSGLLVNPVYSPIDWILLIWATVTGIFITYRFNDAIDQTDNFDFRPKEFLKNKINLFIILQFILVVFPLGLSILSWFRFWLLGAMFALGMLYSVKFGSFRLKHVFFVKNFLIGICWGGLVLIGANNMQDQVALSLFILASIQVFIGSSIRDINDIDQDSQEYVHSIPVVIGIDNSIIFFHALNTLSLVLGMLMLGKSVYLAAFALVYLWRMLLLVQIRKNPQNLIWSQRLNLLSCLVIFIGIDNSIIFFHALNTLSLVLGMLMLGKSVYLAAFALVYLWRMLLLVQIRKNPAKFNLVATT
jgi:4-hydroxybenzoate polyprenyltransferase